MGDHARCGESSNKPVPGGSVPRPVEAVPGAGAGGESWTPPGFRVSEAGGPLGK